MKKVMFLFVFLMIGIFLFANGSAEESSASKEKVNPAGQFPIVNEGLTLSVFMAQDPLVVSYEDNYLSRLLEEQTNIKVDWNLVPSASSAEKLNLVLAGGVDLPDVVMVNVSNEVALKYGGEGTFLALNDFIDEYGEETMQVAHEFSKKGVDFLKMYTALDGNIYGLPELNVCPQCEVIWRCWVDSEWLSTLNLDMPETTEEFREMLIAFKTGDPNGNGKADEIPLMAARTGWGAQLEGFLMMPFIVYNAGTGDRLVLDSKTGEITPAYTRKEWLEGIKYIRNLIDDKLLDPVSLTQTNQEMKVVGEMMPPKTGAYMGANFQFLTLKDDKFMRFTTVPPLKGVTTGKSQTFSNVFQPFGQIKFLITETCDNPEAAFRWGDYMYNENISMIMRYGKEGEDWVKAASDELNPLGKPASFKEVSQWTTPTKNSWRQGGLFFLTGNHQLFDRYFPAGNQATQFVANSQSYWDAAVGNSVPSLFMQPTEVDEYSELKNTLDTYVDETFARMVVGDLSLDNWDEFQDELKKIGIDRFIEMTEAAYKRQYMSK